MRTMTWKTFARKLRDGELEVVAWGLDERTVEVRVWSRAGARPVGQYLELTGKKVEL